MKRKIAFGLIGLIVALLALTLTTTPAFAHEKRHVGNYTFVVGFLNEPAYLNQLNSIDFTVCQGSDCTYTVKDGQRVLSNPVQDAEKTLKAEVSMGGSAPLALPLKPRYGNPGKYSSYFLPTKTGAYTFHIFGTLNGQNIDEKFTSGPNTFGEVEPLNTYPAVASQAQSGDNNNAAALRQQVQAARDSANTATIFGIAGSLLGIVGLGTAIFALTRKPSAATAGAASAAEKTPTDSLRG
ncbi:MAG: hypothetical protein IMW89_09445 [Ktedonobacteraceae bacterium]|nr:hypothetical protein [Ktedonobacteraceae bacterium]